MSTAIQSLPIVRNLIILLACVSTLAATRIANAQTPDDEPVAAASEGVVNINTANLEQLRFLPRVGEEKAQRIIAHREKTPFKTVNEFARVRGIGLKTLRALKPWLTINGPTTLQTKAQLAPKKARAKVVKDTAGAGEAQAGN